MGSEGIYKEIIHNFIDVFVRIDLVNFKFHDDSSAIFPPGEELWRL